MITDGKQLLRTFRRQLPKAESAALEAALSVAASLDARLALVGGPVRDLMLGRAVIDIDIAVEGDVQELARRLALATGYKAVQHGRFGTATLRGEGFSFDFARARRETYERPGALPDVEAATIEEDLERRDFTVNAIALGLAPDAGHLLDPHGGAADIEARLIRVLHDRSFQDDATRMLRACRYAARLSFAIEPSTLGLIRRDLPYLDAISGPRLRRELGLLFREDKAVTGTEHAEALGVLRRIHPLLRISRAVAEAWREALGGEHFAPIDELGFCMVSNCVTDADVVALSGRLHLTGKLEAALTDLVRLRDLFAKLEQPALAAVDAVDILERFRPAAVWAFGLKSGGHAREVCLAYLGEWRRVKPSLNGFDLQALNLPALAGAELGVALKRLRQARLRGEVQTRREEVDLILREFGPGSGSR